MTQQDTQPPAETLAEAREAAALAFDAGARKASHPEVVTLERHHAKVIRAGEGVNYDAVQAALIALIRRAGGEAIPAGEATRFRAMEEWDCRDEAVLLLVDYRDGGDHPLEDALFAVTIGHNNDHNVGDGEGQGWRFAGWCWTHDHYVEGKGKPVGWLPIPHILARAHAAFEGEPTPKPPAGGDAGADAADILDQYASFIRDEVKADDLERHPYLPHIEQVAADLRAALALPAPVVEGDSPYVAGPIWAEEEDDCFTAEIQVSGGYYVAATVHGATRDEVEQRQRAIIAALSEGRSHG